VVNPKLVYFISSSTTEGGLPYLKGWFQLSVSCYVFVFSGRENSVKKICTTCVEIGCWTSMKYCPLSSCIRGLYAGGTCTERHPAKHNRLLGLKGVGHLLQNPDNGGMGGCVPIETAKHFGNHVTLLKSTSNKQKGLCVNRVNAVKTKEALGETLIFIQKQRVV
jgi:hypothetical protein